MDEAIILESDKVFRWEGPKRKQTLAHAKLGRLVLTERRLLFLSTGKNDLNLRRIGGAALTPLAALTTGQTSHLDLEAAYADGGLDVAIEHLRTAELTSMFKVLTISWDTGAGPIFSTFAPKNGGMPDGSQWVDAIRRAIDGAGAHRPTAAAVALPVAASSAAHEPSASADPEFAPPMDSGLRDAPSRPGTAVAGFRNPDRLAATVDDLTRRFGPAILDDPSRVRNLLRDDYGADATRDRSDIDTFVSVLEHRPLSALDEGRSEREVASDLSRATSIDEPGALWTLSVLQRSRPSVPGATVLEVTPAPSGPRGRGGPSPTLIEPTVPPPPFHRSRAGILVAIVAVLGLAATLGAWFAGRSTLDDWKQRALAAEAEATSNDAPAPTPALDDAPAATLPENQDDADADAGTDAGTDTDTDTDTEDYRSEYEAAIAQVAQLTAKRDQLAKAVDDRQAKIIELRDQLAAVTSRLDEQTKSFVATPTHPLGAIDGTGDLTRCEGVRNNECSPTYYMFAHIIEDNGQRFFEATDIARIPITSDGARWTGAADVIGQYGAFDCNGERMSTTMSINLLPAEYRVDPGSRKIVVVAYDVDFAMSTSGGSCTASTQSYRGRFVFS